ncbi:MAG: sulfotransferase family 2 domain-containing protein [Planctomycetaceae bacterium]
MQFGMGNLDADCRIDRKPPLLRRLELREARIPQPPGQLTRIAEFLGKSIVRMPLPECPFVDKPRLLFLHVPKSGGTSFDSFLSTFFSLDEIQPVREQYAAFQWRLDRSSSSRYLHLLNHWFRLKNWLSDLHIITMLRQPVERIVSEYWYLRTTTDYGLCFPEIAASEQPRLNCTRQCTLDDWIRLPARDGNGPLRNVYTSILSSCPRRFEQANRLKKRYLFSVAKRTLRDHLSFFGIVEHYETSKELFCRTFGLPRHYAVGQERCNVAVERSTRTPTSDSALSYLRRENAWDLELYDFACELFADRVRQFGNTPWSDSSRDSPFALDIAALPPSGSVRFHSSQLRGSGLYREEPSPDGQSHRWTGLLPAATIDLGYRFPAGTEIDLRLQVIAAASEQAWNSLRLSWNGQRPTNRKLSYDGRSWWLDATFTTVDGCPISSPTLEVHGDLIGHHASQERRHLGVAIRSIALTWRPMAAPIAQSDFPTATSAGITADANAA